MKKVTLIAAGLAIILATKAYAYNDGDFQIWHTQNQEFKVNPESKVTLEEEFRWGDDASDFYYQHYDAGFVYSLNKQFNLGVNYRQICEKKNGDWKTENRPHLNASLIAEFSGFRLDDRNRIEYRNYDYQPDSWWYSNKLTLKFPGKWTGLAIQPYLADEVFVELNNGYLARNRLYSGFGFDLSQHIKGELCYLLQRSKSSGVWTDINVVGTKLKLIF